MDRIWALIRVKLTIVGNRLSTGSASSRAWPLLFRTVSLLLLLALLRFAVTWLEETGRFVVSRYGFEVFRTFTNLSLVTGLLLSMFVNLLVFVSEEFDATEATRDTNLLLALPLTLRQIVWAKVILRTFQDMYGLCLLVPPLVVYGRIMGLSSWGYLGLGAIYVALEIGQGFVGMVVYLAGAHRLSRSRLETFKLVVGLFLPALLAVMAAMLKESVNDGRIVDCHARWGFALGATPLAWALDGLVPGAALSRLVAGLAGLAAIVAVANLAIHHLGRAVSKLSEGERPGRVGDWLLRTFARLRWPVPILAVKDAVLTFRRKVFLLTSVVMPLGVASVNVLLILLNAGASRSDPTIQHLANSSMLVSVAFIAYLTASQSFGLVEQGKIPFLQTLPVSFHQVMLAKVVFWCPFVIATGISVKLAFLWCFGPFTVGALAGHTLWIVVAALLCTHAAVGVAALFPVFESGILGERRINIMVGGLLYLMVGLTAGLLLFGLRPINKAVLLLLVVLSWLGAGSQVLLGVASVAYLREKEPDPAVPLGFPPPSAGAAALAAVSVVTLLNLVGPLVVRFGTGSPGYFELLITRTTSLHAIAVVVFAALVLAPVSEELFFRGVLYRAARAQLGEVQGVVLSALLFAVLHVDRPVLLMALLGVLLALAYRATGTLVASIGAHFLFNWTNLVLYLWHRPADVTILAGLGRDGLCWAIAALAVPPALAFWLVLRLVIFRIASSPRHRAV
ncbi:MAG: CPBP family intramembrane metalloprotease [Candidatus Riflebacteria bacterium]|nr:CPBP family intramembrane metalloprotease [Candidatus Riflebacteria bacterium]